MKNIMKVVLPVFYFLLSFVLFGCMINDASPILNINNFDVEKNRAVIVFSISPSDFSRVREIKFDQYDISKQQITGGCFFYTRLIAKVDPSGKGVQYFFFDAPPGYYSQNYIAWIDGVRVGGEKEVAFLAPGGAVTYIGDISEKENVFSINTLRDSGDLISNFPEKIKLFRGALLRPKPVFVRMPTSILCMP